MFNKDGWLSAPVVEEVALTTVDDEVNDRRRDRQSVLSSIEPFI